MYFYKQEKMLYKLHIYLRIKNLRTLLSLTWGCPPRATEDTVLPLSPVLELNSETLDSAHTSVWVSCRCLSPCLRQIPDLWKKHIHTLSYKSCCSKSQLWMITTPHCMCRLTQWDQGTVQRSTPSSRVELEQLSQAANCMSTQHSRVQKRHYKP